MWWVGSERADVFVGAGIAGVAVRDAVSWWDVPSPQDAWHRAQELLASTVRRRHLRRPSVRVWLSGNLARPFLLPEVPGLRQCREALEVARSLCASTAGLSDPARIWLHDWRAGRSCLAVAVPESVIELVEAGAKKSGMSIGAIQPWWTQPLNALFASESPPSTVAVDDGESLVVATAGGGVITAVSAYGRMDGAQARATVMRAAFLDGRQDASAAMVRRSSESAAEQSEGTVVADVSFGARCIALQ